MKSITNSISGILSFIVILAMIPFTLQAGMQGDIKNTNEVYVKHDDITGGELKYTPVNTYYLNIPPSAFVKNDRYEEVLWGGNIYKYTQPAGSGNQLDCEAEAPIYLPVGAIITTVNIYYYDNSVVENVHLAFSLRRRSMSSTSHYTMAQGSTVTSTASETIRVLTDDSVLNGTIQSNYCYWVSLYWDPTRFFPDYLRFYGARISYTLQEVALCEGDFDLDNDVDGSDLANFAADFGRTDCGSGSPCDGDFDYDNDVDGSDLAAFAADFGRTDCP